MVSEFLSERSSISTLLLSGLSFGAVVWCDDIWPPS